MIEYLENFSQFKRFIEEKTEDRMQWIIFVCKIYDKYFNMQNNTRMKENICIILKKINAEILDRFF